MLKKITLRVAVSFCFFNLVESNNAFAVRHFIRLETLDSQLEQVRRRGRASARDHILSNFMNNESADSSAIENEARQVVLSHADTGARASLMRNALQLNTYVCVPVSIDPYIDPCIQLAYSNPAFNNVGKLVGFLKSDKSKILHGSAVLLRSPDKTFCTTAAHILFPEYDYYVGFELKRGGLAFYPVDGYEIHPEYDATSSLKLKANPDIAILHLGASVNELDGLDPSYEFGIGADIVSHDMPTLTYIGYPGDSKVRYAVRSRLKYINYDYRNTLQSEMHQGTVTRRVRSAFAASLLRNLVGTDFSSTKKREPYFCEKGMKRGMSGGLTWNDSALKDGEESKFVGINAAFIEAARGLYYFQDFIGGYSDAKINKRVSKSEIERPFNPINATLQYLGGLHHPLMSGRIEFSLTVTKATTAWLRAVKSARDRAEYINSGFEMGDYRILQDTLPFINESTSFRHYKGWVEKTISNLFVSSKEAADKSLREYDASLALFDAGNDKELMEIASDDQHRYQLKALSMLVKKTSHAQFVASMYHHIATSGFDLFKQFSASQSLHLSGSKDAEVGLEVLLEIAGNEFHPCYEQALKHVKKLKQKRKLKVRALEEAES